MRLCLRFFALALSLSLFSSNSSAQIEQTRSANRILEKNNIYQSIVKVEVATQVADYTSPWKAGRFGGGIGTGFLVGENMFLTNAHVVSNARRILITVHGSARKHPAKILHIAHDCDLAIIQVDDFSPFKAMHYLEFGDMPMLDSQVRAIGYPIGGRRISVTRGVVSRIDFNTYSHSQIDAHLVVQIDAAINPGNSGGPVLQDGKVVGVAFQGLRRADNTGYIIPTPVVRRFFQDIEDGKYDHYVDMGIREFPLFNPAMRKKFSLRENDPGVLVAAINPDGPCDGVLQINDILVSINGKSVDAAGNVNIDGEKVTMNEIVERKFSGDKIDFEIIRDGKRIKKACTLKPYPPIKMYSVKYGLKPRYTVFAGLVFQPLERNLYSAYDFTNTHVRRLYARYIQDGIFKKRKDIVILTRVLSDPINSYADNFVGTAIESINSKEIHSLDQVHELLNAEDSPEFFVIKHEGILRPLIIDGRKAKQANRKINENYGIFVPYNLNENK